jgi:Protein of unknown function (DUF3306)
MAFDEGFLNRWSRRKTEAKLPSGSLHSTPPTDPALEMNSAQESSEEPATNVDCASLEFSSDFSRFVNSGISDALQRAALRRLWATNPLFGASDGLDVYRADYAHASPPGVLAAAGRALQMATTEQGAIEQPPASLAAISRPQNELASGAEKEKPQSPEAQELQTSG